MGKRDFNLPFWFPVLIEFVNYKVSINESNNLFSKRKRARAGSSERQIGHRVSCYLLQLACSTKIKKRNNEKNPHESAKLAQKMFFLPLSYGHELLVTNCALLNLRKIGTHANSDNPHVCILKIDQIFSNC